MGRFTQVPVENGSQSSTSRRYVAIAADSLAGTWILAVDHPLSPVVVLILDYLLRIPGRVTIFDDELNHIKENSIDERDAALEWV